MSYDTTTTPAVGDATKRSDYVRLRDSIKAVRQQSWDFGGGLGEFIEDAANTWVDLPNGKIKELNGDDTNGLSIYLAMTCLQDAAGAVTVETRLYNITTAAAVASSDASQANPGTSAVYKKGVAFTLAAGTDQYKVQIRRTTTAARVAALVEVFTL
jgi:hypothetical protein